MGEIPVNSQTVSPKDPRCKSAHMSRLKKRFRSTTWSWLACKNDDNRIFTCPVVTVAATTELLGQVHVSPTKQLLTSTTAIRQAVQLLIDG